MLLSQSSHEFDRERISSGVEPDNATLASLSSRIITDEKEPGREIVLGRSSPVERSVLEAACQLLRETRRALLAKELFKRPLERDDPG